MLRNYIKIAIRNLLKNRSYSLINIGGLALGITCAMLIYMIVQFELSFDAYHEKADRIYRVVKMEREFGRIGFGDGVPYPLPDALREEFKEIENLSIVEHNITPSVLSVEKNNVREKFSVGDLPGKFAYVQPDYFEIFDYEWLLGDPKTALSRPGTFVLSKDVANIVFGNINPIGETVTLDGETKVEVTGVVDPLPDNTDLPFSMLGYYQIPEWAVDNWGSVSSSTQCYFSLPEGTDPSVITAGLEAFVDKYGIEDEGEELTLMLQPLSDVHSDDRFNNFGRRVATAAYLWALGVIGLFLLITACINFINLNTAVAVRRSREVGIRKVLGGTRAQLILYFLIETALITLLAIFISLLLAEIASGYLGLFLEYKLEFLRFVDLQFMLFVGILHFLVTIVAGLYPAFVLSGFNPIEAIRNRIRASYGKGISLRRGLVVFQFAISQILIIAMIVIWNQMDHIMNADMGFEKEAVVEVPVPVTEQAVLDQFRSSLAQQTSVKSMSYSNTGAASDNTWSGDFTFYDTDEAKVEHAHMKFIDEHFDETYRIELVAGEPIQPLTSDSVTQMVVNETFARKMGYGDRYHDILGREINFWGHRAPIVGVVKDFNTRSLHGEVTPVVMMKSNRYMQAGIRIDMNRAEQALAAIKDAWTSAFPQFVYEYRFLDETIRQFYEGERKGARLVNIFTTIAIIIGCLGLFGLVSYMASTRTKEIGVRKVLGATVQDIIAIFSKEILILVGLAFILAAPLGYLLAQSWLQDFAYQIDLHAGFFAAALGITVLFSVATVAYKSVRAATVNPVESLKNE